MDVPLERTEVGSMRKSTRTLGSQNEAGLNGRLGARSNSNPIGSAIKIVGR